MAKLQRPVDDRPAFDETTCRTCKNQLMLHVDERGVTTRICLVCRQTYVSTEPVSLIQNATCWHTSRGAGSQRIRLVTRRAWLNE